jgi:enoyl-CoA hydratase/carnithine racemase
MSLRSEMLEGGILRLTLERPQAANALDRALQEALVVALERAAADAAARAVLLTASGGRVFSAGADLREDLGPDAGRLRRALLVRTLLAVLDCPKPLLAVVRGKAVGGGAMLALLADEVLMEEGASLSFPEIAIRMPSPIGAAIVSARGGRAAAQWLVQSGRPMSAAEARVAGLADAVHPDAALDGMAQGRAGSLAVLDGHAYAVNKQWMNAPLRDAMHRAAAHAEAAAQ